MQTKRGTVIGIFSDVTDAKRATDELHSLAFCSARLVENDRAAKFTGTAEHEGATDDPDSSEAHPMRTGISAFFARLFGLDDDDRPSLNLHADSQAYFQDAYDKKHHLVIIEDCPDVSRCHDILASFGGVVEERGSQYYERERDKTHDLETLGLRSGDTLAPTPDPVPRQPDIIQPPM